jgi:hypothetical protein
MEEGLIVNRAEVPFAAILENLLLSNLTQRLEKRAVFDKMNGAVAIDLADIEAAVTLQFEGGKLLISDGVLAGADLIIGTTSDRVMDLNSLRIVGGLPWYFDEAGLKVVGHLLAGRLKIAGMFSHPVLLTRLTKIMSVM